MKILNFGTNKDCIPKVSIVLIDWSCRESLHILDYLGNQTAPRDTYEIIWVEYYDRKSPEIESRLNTCAKLNKPPVVDKWIIMDIPSHIYYHKHLMYNIGIAASKGEIVTICDSDTIVTSTFIESIVKAFENDRNIVLYMDEVRNFNKRFYPFNYPSIEEVTGEGAVNFKNGKTTGLLDEYDSLHTRNYGACVCAFRQDIVEIGGADEHVDYLGYICGPYELAFRLVNAGKKEVWHQKELLYHVWHPGSVGVNDYMGPHDGYNMSAPALDTMRTGRIMPLIENCAIQKLRLSENHGIIDESLLLHAIAEGRINDWKIDEKKRLIFSGRLAHYKGDHEEALRCWEKILRDFPAEKSFINEMAWAYYHKSRYKEALKLFNEVLMRDESSQSALRGRGWLNYRLGNYRSSIEDFNRLTEYPRGLTKKTLQEIHRAVGRAQYDKGNVKDAKINFLMALENIDPADETLICETKNALALTSAGKNKSTANNFKFFIIRNGYFLKNTLKSHKSLVTIKRKLTNLLKSSKV